MWREDGAFVGIVAEYDGDFHEFAFSEEGEGIVRYEIVVDRGAVGV